MVKNVTSKITPKSRKMKIPDFIRKQSLMIPNGPWHQITSKDMLRDHLGPSNMKNIFLEGCFWLLFFGRICKLTTLIIPRPARGILDVATLRSFCNFFREMIPGAFSPSRRIEKFMLFRPVLYSFSGLDFVSIFDAFWLHFRSKNPPKWAKMGSGRVSKKTQIFGTCF